jgi:hypothetical protein
MNTGVTFGQAVSTLNQAVSTVTPSKARQAAQGAVQQAVAYMQRVVASGGIVGRTSKPVGFTYRNYSDARIDVENLIGYNLRS